MVFRVFAVVWGALVLTLVLFGMTVAALDTAPPDGAIARAEQDVVRRELALIAGSDGVPAALSIWSAVSAAHPMVLVLADPSCAGEDTVQGSDGTCLTVASSLQEGRFLVGLRMLLPPLLVGVAVSAAGAVLLSHHLTRPIRTVNAALQCLAAGDLDTRIAGALNGSGGELSRLGHAFDHAADRLQKLSEGQRRLFTDLSHEIRSPLARLRAAVGLLEVSPDRLAEMLRQIETDIVRLDTLVRDILTLARYESVDDRTDFEPLDLVDILEPIIADANFEGEARNVCFTYSGPARAKILGNAELLHRAIENVIRNALAHSPNGGSVQVQVRREASTLVLDVLDQGSGVSDSEKSRLFKPFVRIQKSGQREGSGLGLAIAASAVAAHGGSIAAIDNIPNGLVVRIAL